MSDNDRATRVQIALAEANRRTGFFDHQTPERSDREINTIMGAIFGLPMDDDLRDRLVSDFEKIGCHAIAVNFNPNGEVTVTGTTILSDKFSAVLHAGFSVP